MHHGFGVLPLVLLALVISSCALRSPLVTGDPEATFVAHQANSILLIDRMAGGQPLTLRPERSWPGSAVYVPSAGDWTLSLAGPGEVTVDHRNDPGHYESVVPSWDNNALRLTLELHEHAPLHTDVLARLTGGAGPSSFTRLVQTMMDVRGSYEGAVRDRAGTRVGWLRLRIGEDEAHVVCEGVLPPDVDEAMIAATSLAFVSEVEAIEGHLPESRPSSDS